MLVSAQQKSVLAKCRMGQNLERRSDLWAGNKAGRKERGCAESLLGHGEEKIALLTFSLGGTVGRSGDGELFGAQCRYCHKDVIRFTGSGSAQTVYNAVNQNRKI